MFLELSDETGTARAIIEGWDGRHFGEIRPILSEFNKLWSNDRWVPYPSALIFCYWTESQNEKLRKTVLQCTSLYVMVCLIDTRAFLVLIKWYICACVWIYHPGDFEGAHIKPVHPEGRVQTTRPGWHICVNFGKNIFSKTSFLWPALDFIYEGWAR